MRAAAGDLFFNRSDTDYFPSYELITAPAFKGQFFELNQRQVTSQGVAFVMRQFFNGYGISDENSDETLSVKKIKKNTSTQITGDVIATEVCDEIILESWRNNPVDELSTPKNILLIGDSHMGMLSNILTKSGITHAGGATMNASEWHAMKFTVDDDIIFKPNNAEQLSNWEAAFNSMGGKSSYNLSRRPVCLTNLGIQRNEAWFRGFIGEHLKNIYGTNIPPQIQVADLKNYILSARINHIGLICRLLAMNYQVIVVSDPPVESPDDTSACSMTDSLLLDLYKSVGCQIFNARDWINEIGGLPEKYRSTDAMHGSEIYYRDLQMVLFHKFLIKNK